MLMQDEHPGLEVLRDGRWHLVRVAPRRAGGQHRRHRPGVVERPLQGGAAPRGRREPGAERYSIPFFLNPSYETTYEPLPTTVTRERPASYRRISWREFRSLRAAGDYADIGEEVQIHHYRR